ncbi:MAG: hypothetical protein ACI8QZ_001576 [Chlamydiales bacterium]|jgi:hypothetical protein
MRIYQFAFLAASLAGGFAQAAVQSTPTNMTRASRSTSQPLDCAFQSAEQWVADLHAAAVRGEVAAPSMRSVPQVVPRGTAQLGLGVACLTNDQIFAYEDSSQVLLTNFSNGQLFDLMIEASNAMLAQHGDLYDFVGFWTNFVPNHKIGAAFYAGIENDVQGVGSSLYNSRADLGLAGDNLEGFIMMWNVNNSYWQPGTGANADFTRLALAQEFEHRFAMFLPNLLDGRQLQGNNGSCGRGAHWNWRVDGQGSGMEISEWVGSTPAQLAGSFVTFNTDITGGVFSYSDLYLMGYVSPMEMDAGNSELRYMDGSGCAGDYNGIISTFSSADIIASAGPRMPTSASAQKNFRTGWIMLHQPGDAPSSADLGKSVAILEQHQADWQLSTLGRGSMNNQLFDDCNCNGVPDAQDVANLTSTDHNTNGLPDECEQVGASYCIGAANSAGPGASLVAIGSDAVTENNFTLAATACPASVSGLFYFGTSQIQAPFGEGFRCVGGMTHRVQPPQMTDGSGLGVRALDLTQPPAAGNAVAGTTLRFQFWYRDIPGGPNGFNLTDAVRVDWN